MKKLFALFLLVGFIVIGSTDVYNFLTTGRYKQSFESFYTLLIFCDILIVLVALRYSTAYNVIFKYSSFALATMCIEMENFVVVRNDEEQIERSYPLVFSLDG